MKKLTYEEFGKVMELVLHNKHTFNTRLGQEIFNEVYLINPELADSLRATDVDCFHQDSKIIHFINAILEK